MGISWYSARKLERGEAEALTKASGVVATVSVVETVEPLSGAVTITAVASDALVDNTPRFAGKRMCHSAATIGWRTVL